MDLPARRLREAKRRGAMLPRRPDCLLVGTCRKLPYATLQALHVSIEVYETDILKIVLERFAGDTGCRGASQAVAKRGLH